MEKNGKVLKFSSGLNKYKQIADRKAEQGDYVTSLGFLFASLRNGEDYTIFGEIADVYAEMGLLTLSNLFWFKYLSKSPEEKATVAYEQLAINFFYMDNYFPASYYFHQKLSKDGYISKDGLDEEVLNFFYQTFDKKSAYHIAYPFDRADWSFTEKLAKHALAGGDYTSAEKLYASIPKECRSEDVSGEYAVSLFLNKKDKEMIEACKASLLHNGENVTAYCNLSSLYHAKKDLDKSAYYYQQALNLSKFDINDSYKLATCAMEQKDHYTASVCLQKILQEREHDVTMNYFYAVAQTNLGNYQTAAQRFCEIYRIYPKDNVIKFYAEYLSNVVETGSDCKNLFPLAYAKELPPQITKNYKRKISELFADPKKANSQIKRKDIQNVLEWGLKQAEGEYAKHSAYVISNSEIEWSEKVLLESLMDIDVSSEVKRVIITLLVLKGYRTKIPVIANDFYVEVKAKKMVFDGKLDGDLFLAGYALTLSRMAFWNIDGWDKIAFSMNKLYKKLGSSVYLSGVTAEELGAIAVCMSKFERLESPDYVCKFFDARPQVVKEQLNILKGAKK